MADSRQRPWSWLANGFCFRRLALLAAALALVSCGSASASSYSDLVTSLGPVGYWRLGESSGTTAVDETGAHDGAYQNGVTLGQAGALSGDADTAADFAGGANDRVQVPDIGVTGTGITMMAWFKADAISDDRLISKATGTSVGQHQWMLGIDSNRIKVRMRIGSSVADVTASVPLSTGEWYFAAVTHDGSYIRVYLNGVLVDSTSYPGTITSDTAIDAAIGNQPSTFGNRAFNGDLDDVALFDRALTDLELANLYATGSGARGDLVGHWQLDETTGSLAADSSAFGNDGSYTNGPTLGQTGEVGNAVQFDGSNDYVEVADDASLQTRSHTIAAWVKIPGSIPSGWKAIVERGRWTTNWLGLFKTSGSDTFHYRFKGDDSVPRSVDTATTIVADTWYHVAGTYDASTGVAKVYLNGALDGSTTSTSSPTPAADVLRIGANSDNGEHFPGLIDDVRVYNRALTADEVAGLGASLTTSLALHLKLDETSGTTATDSSGSGADGSYVNSPTLGVDAPHGYAATLNGADTNDRIDLPHTVVDGATALSISWWMRTTDTSYQIVLSGANAASNNECLVYFQDHTTFRPHVDDVAYTMSVDSIATGRWRHCVYMVDRAAGSHQLYIDGSLAASGSIPVSGDSFEIDSGGLMIGQEQDAVGGGFDSSQIFDGDLDEYRVYRRILSEAEIKELYGLVAHWKLDETSGTVAADSSGLGNDATYDGTPILGADGPHGYAHELDGTNNAKTPSLLGQPEDISFAAWVNLDAADTSGAEVVSLGNRAILRVGWQSNQLSLAIRPDVGSNSWTHTTHVHDLSGSGWRHVAGTFNDASNTTKLYLDGELVQTGTVSQPIYYGSDYALTSQTVIGANGYDGAPQYDFDGKLDDIRVYSRVLNAIEIKELYGLLGHWKFDETSGTTVADSSGLGNDGQCATAPAFGQEAPHGYGAEFTTADQRVTIPESDALNNLTADDADLTVSFWVKPGEPDGNWRSVFNKQSGSSSRRMPGIWLQNNTNQVHFRIGTTAATNDGGDSSQWLAAGRWSHVVVRKHLDQYSVYINGEHDYTDTLGAPTVASDGPLYLGEGGGGNFPLKGQLDEVRVYNRSLDEQEIKELYGLVGHWKLDETSGTVTADSSGLGNDGTIEGGVTLGGEGPRGYAMEFEGVDGRVSVPGAEALNLRDSLTVTCWAKSAQETWNAHGCLISKRDQFVLHPYPGATKQITSFVASSVDGWSAHSVLPDTIARWRHYAMTFDAVRGTLTSYLDGVYQGETALTAGASLGYNEDVLMIGQDDGHSDRFFDGQIDDVRVFNRTLDETDIKELYGLVGHWRLDETSGTTATDSSGLGNDAAIEGGVTLGGAGPRQLAMDFDGVDGRLVVTGNTSLNLRDGLTVACWANSDPETWNTWGCLVSKRNQLILSPYPNAANLTVSFVWADGESYWTSHGYRPDRVDRWRHYAMTYDAARGTLGSYVDGVYQGQNTLPLGSRLQTDAGMITIGNDEGIADRYFDGQMDDVRVYNRALTDGEINELYGLVGHWRFEEASGAVASDSSGAGNDGTVDGNANWTTEAKEGFGALELDGVTYVEVPGLIVPGSHVNDTADGVTISGWAKLTAADTGGAEVISLGDHLTIRLDNPSTGTRAFGYTGGGWYGPELGENHEGSGWRHFTAVYDERNLELSLYVDGILEETTALTGPISMAGLGSSTRFGRHGGTQTAFDFLGTLDDLRVYNRALTRDEVRALYYGQYLTSLRIISWVEIPNP